MAARCCAGIGSPKSRGDFGGVMGRSRIAAVGMTRFGRHEASFLDLAADAVRALDPGRPAAPSGASAADVAAARGVDHVLLATAFPGSFAGLANAAVALVDRLGMAGVAATRVETAPSSSLAALEVADALVRSGRRERVLVVGCETMTRLDTAAANAVLGRMTQPDERAQGATMAAQVARMTEAYQARFGVSREQLLASPHKAHDLAASNPYAHFQKSVAMDRMVDAPIVAPPLGRYDCAPLSDGAAAFVVAREGPVTVEGIGHATDRWGLEGRGSDPEEALVTFDATRRAARSAFEEAGWTHDDVDLMETHDAFSLLEGMNLEDLGFLPKGEGVRAVAAGETGVNGRRPTNLGGGLKARGHPIGATGAAQVCELYWRLVGAKGVTTPARPPRRALAHNIGGLGNNVLVALLSGPQER